MNAAAPLAGEAASAVADTVVSMPNEPAEPLPPPRYRQMRLLDPGNPLAARLGDTFFRALPRQPGVYFFYDRHDRLLYIGQSNDLRARVGSYRHVCPERHPRRTLRLVHNIARVEFECCGSHAEAKRREAALLLERRPPYNRAGVWQGAPWWLELHAQDDVTLSVSLSRRSGEELPPSIGPLDASFRYVHAALLRCVVRWSQPVLPFAGFPLGLLQPAAPLRMKVRLSSGASDLAAFIASFATRQDEVLLLALESGLLTPESSPTELVYWGDQLQVLRRYWSKKEQLALGPLPAPAKHSQEPLPLFPDL